MIKEEYNIHETIPDWKLVCKYCGVRAIIINDDGFIQLQAGISLLGDADSDEKFLENLYHKKCKKHFQEKIEELPTYTRNNQQFISKDELKEILDE